jgi:hypothetical protein
MSDKNKIFNDDINPLIFKGTLQKMQLITNALGFCRPEPHQEAEQRLTITANGKVWFSRYCIASDFIEQELTEKTQFSIPCTTAENIMNAVSSYFSNKYAYDLATDVGTWNLKLTNTDGRKFQMRGSLLHEPLSPLGKLSDMIRNSLNMQDLFVFDGNSD